MQRACWTRAPSSATLNAASACCTPLCLTASRSPLRHAVWSAVQNVVWPLRTEMMCPVMTQDAVQFSGAVSTGSGMASLACFTGRQVFSLVGSPPSVPKRDPGEKPPGGPPLPGQKPRPHHGLPSAQKPTPVGGTFAVLHMQTAGALGQPLPVWQFTMSIPPPSSPTTLSPLTRLLEIPPDSDGPSQPGFPSLGNVLCPGRRSPWSRPRYSWSAPGNIPGPVPKPASPESGPGPRRTFPPPPHHQGILQSCICRLWVL